MSDAIPFEHGGPGLPLVIAQGEVASGMPVAVLVDTGAIAAYPLFMSEALAKKLGLKLSASVTVARSVAIGAAPTSFRPARLTRFRLGPVELRDVEVAVTPVIETLNGHLQRKVDVIVGQHFLKGRTVSIDYAARRLDLTGEVGPSRTAIAAIPGGPFTLIPVRMNKARTVMEIDTGATGASLSPEAAKRAKIKEKASVTVSGAGGGIPGKVGRATIAFGPVQRKKDQIAIHEGMEKISATAGTRVDGILGGRTLEATRLTIDYPGNRVWIEKSP